MQHLAQQVQAQGRGDDTMLVHMTPGEVRGLQALAEAKGGSLTINPHTGLPEAGFLSSMIPMIAGAAGMFLGIPPMITSALVGAGMGVATGNISKGLMAGLGAYGGASLAGGLGVGANGGAMSGMFGGAAPGAAAVPGSLATTATNALPTTALAAPSPILTGPLSTSGVPASFTSAAPGSLATTATNVFPGPIATDPTRALSGMSNAVPAPLASQAAFTAAGGTGPGFPNSFGQFQSQFSDAARTGLTPGGMLSKFAPTAATMGLTSSAFGAFQPDNTPSNPSTEQKSNYKGPYMAAPRVARFPGDNRPLSDTSEFQYFDNVNPYPNVVTAASQGYAHGGNVNMEDGAFIVDARTVSELGNGSSRAGQELLAKHGGVPLHGPGDGVSDSIPANIGGTQEARVARDEVKFDPQAVARIGGGDQKRGTQKLYSLMDKAAAARKRANRGDDTKLRGLSVLK